jgi:hypothetical protein
VSLAGTRGVLYVVNRPGNAPSHQGAAEWIDKAIDLVAPHASRVCLPGDTDFSLTAHFDRWAQRVDFIFGIDNTQALRQRAETLDDRRWRRLHRPTRYQTTTGKTRPRRPNHKQRIVRERGYLNLTLNVEDVAEFFYLPGRCARAYRVVVLRKNISRSRGEDVLFDEIRYFFYITTRTDLTAQQVVQLANERCDQENVIEQLKNGVNALRGAAVRPGRQLDLHGHRRPRLEHQVLVRDDAAPQSRPARAHPDGVPPLPDQHHPHPRHGHLSRPRHHRAADRLPPQPGPAVQRHDHHRTHPIRLTHTRTDPHPTAASQPRRPRLPGNPNPPPEHRAQTARPATLWPFNPTTAGPGPTHTDKDPPTRTRTHPP